VLCCCLCLVGCSSGTTSFFKNYWATPKSIEPVPNTTMPTILNTTAVAKEYSLVSYNLDGMTATKANNKFVREGLRQVLTRYDIVLLQDVLITNTTLSSFMGEVLPGYSFVQRESFVIAWTTRVSVKNPLVYPFTEAFTRPPMTALATIDSQKIVIIVVHNNPAVATTEAVRLSDVVSWATKQYGVDKVILAGSLYNDCVYATTAAIPLLSLATPPNADTTLSRFHCAYNRIYQRNVNGSAAVDYYAEEFLPEGLAAVISAQRPVTMVVS
jgi:endonuclease/exonuclease/phosphatase (EEP) superfamily protein YafD